MSETVFYMLAAASVTCAAGVVLLRNPVHSALALVVSLFTIAVSFAALGAHLVAALQIIVYAGAVMILFLFVIMLLNLQIDSPERSPLGLRMAAIAAAAAVGALLARTIANALQGRPRRVPLADGFGSTVELARVLFRDHIVAFELTSLLLLVAVVGAVVLARRDTD